MTTMNLHVDSVAPKSLRALRANCFAALVMLLIEFGLGITVNLYANIPGADHGKGLFSAFGAAVAHGPISLTLHALLGTLLLISSVTAFFRALPVGRTVFIASTGVAFIAILVAWMSGAKFVGSMTNSASLTMALAAGVAVLSYAIVLFIVPAGSPTRVKS